MTSGSPAPHPDAAADRTGDLGAEDEESRSDVDTLVGIITARDYFPLWSTPTDSHAAAMAERILAAGFRRVPEDAAKTLADVAREVRIEASLADRPGQMGRLDEQAARIEVVITALRSVSGGGEQP